ncbi:hypothetical protein [Sorangium atrum]|uniref:Uncharacterized protein n=1 Tax=Sorangium atrum TaxID=2995308 RepID=A0ABT5BW40_9BACT|nr:hypothetical protein [Sorangium aterium]MDC0678358.1 hypothetical protein [Sorangium aterium]
MVRRVFDTSRARVEPLLAEEPSKPAEDRSSARLKAVYTTIEVHDPRNADGSPAETDGIISASVRVDDRGNPRGFGEVHR